MNPSKFHGLSCLWLVILLITDAFGRQRVSGWTKETAMWPVTRTHLIVSHSLFAEGRLFMSGLGGRDMRSVFYLVSSEGSFGQFALKFFDFILDSKGREEFPSVIGSTTWLVDLLGQTSSQHAFSGNNNKIKTKNCWTTQSQSMIKPFWR